MTQSDKGRKARQGFRQGRKMTSMALGSVALAVAGSAGALELSTGNSDLTARFDNSVRYNLGLRGEGIDSRIGNTPTANSGDYKFRKAGDVVMNRVDLLSEFEAEYQKKFGLRVSAAAWYDQAYDNTKEKTNPSLAPFYAPSYNNGQYSSYTKRWYRDGAELLDAFAYVNTDVNGHALSLKLGQHVVYWGNAIFSGAGIAYSQQPIDGRKGLSEPGAEVRELFLPLNQLSGTYQATQAVQIAGQYYFDWDHVRSPEGGTYFGGNNFTLDGPDSMFGLAQRLSPLGPKNKRGDWGVATRISPPSWNGTTVGLYYREFTEKNGLWLDANGLGALAAGVALPEYTYRAVYPRNTKVIGASLDTTVGPVAVGAELVLRKNAGLNSLTVNPDTNEGARGDVYHAIVNAIYGVPRMAVWDSATLTTELTFDHLASITKNSALFNGVGGANCPLGWKQGCATRNAWGLAVRFEPAYNQIFPGVDLTLPISVQAGLHGNTADFGGTNQGQVLWSVGAQFTMHNNWTITLSYSDMIAKIVRDGGTNALGQPTYTGNGNWSLTDRGIFMLTAKASF